MNRSTLDKLLSSTGLILAVVLLAAYGGLSYAHSFVHSQVHDQLAAQTISFPAAGSPALAALPPADKTAVAKYAGQQLLTGKQAEVFADHFIAVHLKEIGGGKTYAELSAQSMADPSNAALAGRVQIVFRGETLRGLLLNAYAFDTMAVVAQFAAYGALAAGLLLLVLACLGFMHAGRAQKSNRK
ncbi:MAG TPA: hypothetical protein VLF59_02455 [Candidatus Saccharimonadales bacterium]|nr:hypothetical protein [Candidatus Saccharimonadales bacterium]